MSDTVLIVGDGGEARQELPRRLVEAGLRAVTVRPDDVLLEPWTGVAPDAVIVDVDGPLDEQLALCAELRRNTGRPELPAILIGGTGADRERHLVAALERGADDWLARPVEPRELLARVRALLRRTSAARAEPLSSGALALDPRTSEVRVAGRAVLLTLKEFELLQTLMEACGRTIKRRELWQRVWRLGPSSRPASRTLDVHVRRLRQKLGREGGRIVTVRGVGHRLDAPGSFGSAD